MCIAESVCFLNLRMRELLLFLLTFYRQLTVQRGGRGERGSMYLYFFHYKGRKVASKEANSISKGRSCWRRIAVRPSGRKKVRTLDLFIL